MDVIYEGALNFKRITNVRYNFILSKNRKNFSIDVNFQESDYYHLIGLQYLEDLRIDRNPWNTINNILCDNPTITDDILSKSSYYSCKDDGIKDIESRIAESRFLEEYLDEKNVIKIYTLRDIKNAQSKIKADYVIFSRRKLSYYGAYIFLRKRKENNNYCVVSFFKKGSIEYGGEKLYWMMKTKINENGETILYKHENYSPDN